MMPVDVQQRADAELGAAWRRCEAALPEGWRPLAICADDDDWTRWQAATASPAFFEGENDDEQIEGFGRSPAAALDALTEALESRRG